MHTYETIYDELARLGVACQRYEHGPHYTADDALQDVVHWPDGAHVKNLLVKDKAGSLTLITVLHQRRVDLVKLGKYLGSKDRLSFAKEELLWEVLGVKPGSVSPLALANAAPGSLTFVLDTPATTRELLYCHPLINTQTVAMAPADLLRAVQAWGHEPRLIDLGGFEKAC
ncbi:MAG: prolyl-tRNA synthetase associated domain-containing protein [Pseudomonadaceae bacterium]|nr:prolyl-tRNA synthetase associated domain-containing protein [Pseudomonadaceae bacterium]